MKWISVKDRLPEKVHPEDDFDLKLVFDTSISHYHLASYWEDGKWRLTNGFALEEVTHWAELPDPPENL